MAEGRSIRFTVIAHASPRWRGAANAADADKRNQILSQQRENSVRLVVERILRETLGSSVAIRSAVDHMENVTPNGVSVGGYAVGSRDSLRDAKGNRDNNDEIYRKVDVQFERFTTKTHSGPRGTGEMSTRTRKWWILHVDRLHVNYGGANLSGASGEAELTLTNDISHKSVRARAELKGSGYYVGITPSLNPVKMVFSVVRSGMESRWDNYSEKKGVEHAFGCNREMGFRDFAGQTVTFDKKIYSAGVKGYTMSVSFPSLGNEASMMLSPLGGLGGFGHGTYQVSGPIQLLGPIPEDYMEKDPDIVINEATSSDGFKLRLTFPSGQSHYESIEFIKRMAFESIVEGYAKFFEEANS